MKATKAQLNDYGFVGMMTSLLVNIIIAVVCTFMNVHKYFPYGPVIGQFIAVSFWSLYALYINAIKKYKE